MLSPDHLRANLADVRARIAAACARVGRDPAEVKLLPVTKTHPPELIAALLDLGVEEVGENRAQELRAKHAWFVERGLRSPRWHMVGTLQRNKVRQLAECGVAWIHSVDSAALAQEIERQAERRGLAVHALVEVNVSGEASKHGLPPEAVAGFLRSLRPTLRRVHLAGLMTMAPLEAVPEATRPVFRALRALRGRLQEELDCPLPELSMGMSNDFEVAVEEGATIIRIGTALFGAREEEAHG